MINRGRSLLSASAIYLALGASTYAVAQTEAVDGRALSLEMTDTAGYGRMVATWSDGSEAGPDIIARLSGPVLILRFEEPVELDLEAIKEGLPSYIAVARMSEDGREARIALAREYRIHESSSIDRTAIDLVPEAFSGDPPDIVSPLVAVRQRAAEAAAAAAEAARLANIPAPLDVQLRTSQTAGLSTLTFHWPDRIDYRIEDTPEGLRVTFARRGNLDLAPTRVDPPLGLIGIDATNTEDELVVDLDLASGYSGDLVAVENSVMVHFSEGEGRGNQDDGDIPIPAELQALADDLPSNEGVAPPGRKPFQSSPLLARLAREEAGDFLQDSRLVELQEAELAELEATAPDIASLPLREPRLWREALPRSGVVNVSVTERSRGLELEIAFQSDIPSVVFRRNNAIWLAFPVDGEFDLSRIEDQTGTRIDQILSDTGMALRVFVPDDRLIRIDSGGRTWRIEAGGEGELSDRQIKPVRAASLGGSGIHAQIPGSGTVFRLRDPEIGDELIFVPALNPSTALVQQLSFVEAEFPVTTHGLAVIPRADDLNISQRGDFLLINREAGLALSSWGVETEVADGQSLTPGFLDFEAWRHGGQQDFTYNVSRLASAAADGDPEEWSGQTALLELARFYLSWEYSAEAYGPLLLALSGDPLLGQDAQWLTLKGAADIMMGRFDEAIETLEHTNVRNDVASNAWRGLAYAEIGDWRKSRQAFLQAEPMLNAHTPEWAGRFHAAAARAMIRMGDGGSAERHALAAKRSGDDIADGQASLTLGELAVATDRPEDARSIFTRLMGHPDQNVQVRAELADIRLALQQGRMSHLDASDRLDTLRFRWRGDELEIEIVSALADSYFALGQFREALVLAQNVSLEFPDLPGSRELRIKLGDHFKALFLDGRADDLDPIAALALFYEFRDLTPIGPDGDRMIRMLANRLVAFDLLDPATELLAHQVENRNLIGSSRAQIAADLAAIYLLDRRPEKALLTLNSTRQTGIPDELRIERRLLEAASHMELQRYGHAIELLQNVDDQRARDLLAEVHWRARTWGAAGRALQATLPEPGTRLTDGQLQTAVRAAVAYRLDSDAGGLADLRSKYRDVVAGTEEADTFELLTSSTRISSARITDTVRELADTSTADAFLSNLRQRFSRGAGGAP